MWSLLLLLLNSLSQDLHGQSHVDTIAVVSDSLQSVCQEEKNVEPVQAEASLALELSGIVVDESQTKIGRDFYEFFFSIWVAPQSVTDYTITISERPLPQLGTQITVMVNDFEVFQSFVQPRTEAIEEMARYAVQRSAGVLQNYRRIVKQLEGDDMEGTGIF
jgi:curli production assembly/transport component CsgE